MRTTRGGAGRNTAPINCVVVPVLSRSATRMLSPSLAGMVTGSKPPSTAAAAARAPVLRLVMLACTAPGRVPGTAAT